MVPDRINGGWCSYGDDPNLWIESNFLHALRTRYPNESLLCAALDAIEDAAASECAAYRPE
jgi:hypothetical protein